MIKRTILLVPLLLLISCARAPEGVALREIDPAQLTIYHNGIVLTMDENRPVAQAIAVRGPWAGADRPIPAGPLFGYVVFWLVVGFRSLLRPHEN
jgi:hypothetical protein